MSVIEAEYRLIIHTSILILTSDGRERGHLKCVCRAVASDIRQSRFIAEPGIELIELTDGVRASVQHYRTSPAETLQFETHEQYFDVQYLVCGTEKLGCRSRDGLTETAPYDPANDITFYQEPALGGEVLLNSGEFVIFAPEDAHKPRCAAGEPMDVIKIVVKVPV